MVSAMTEAEIKIIETLAGEFGRVTDPDVALYLRRRLETALMPIAYETAMLRDRG
jgi:hypothetical protein